MNRPGKGMFASFLNREKRDIIQRLFPDIKNRLYAFYNLMHAIRGGILLNRNKYAL